MKFTTTQQIQSNNNHSRKLTWYRKRNRELSEQIFDYCRNEIGLNLPYDSFTFEKRPEHYLVDEDGVYHDNLYHLVKAGYQLKKSNKAIYALFQKGNTQRQQIMTCWYSRHRLDHIWNYRKSKLIRKIWSEFLTDSPEILKDCTPRHLVLTVPHKNGIWKGEKFYAREMLRLFKLMRESKIWKKYIFGGEYGMEISKGKNGLHIHFHVLVFQRKGYTRNEVESWIKKTWNKLTGATFIHYETLYIHQKDDSGRWMKETIEPKTMDELVPSQKVVVKDGFERRKKFYLEGEWFDKLSKEEQLEKYTSGVMECIKYHFKNDALESKEIEGVYDIPLVAEVLNNSHYLRMYSKFGGFYGEKRLNYSRIELEEPDFVEFIEENEFTYLQESSIPEMPEEYREYLESEEFLEQLKQDAIEEYGVILSEFDDQKEVPEELQADSDLSVKNLMNPFTGKKAKIGEYKRVMSLPEWQVHNTKLAKYKPTVQEQYRYFEIEEDLTIKECMKYIATSQWRELLTEQGYEKFMKSRALMN